MSRQSAPSGEIRSTATDRLPCRRRRHRSAAAAALLALAVLALYAPVATHDFVDFDDDIMVTENPRVLAGLTLEGLGWSLATLEGRNWQPVTWWSHMLDVSLFGRRPGGHHLVSAAIHAVNAALLLLLLRALTGALWAPAAAAALFALHPLRVESVAWAAERKDVLSTMLWLFAALAYVRWCRSPSRSRYAAVALLFALGLMAKPMLVTLPFTLLLLDAWPLGRASGPRRAPWRCLIVEKLPLLALAVAAAVVTFIAQRAGGAVASLGAVPVARRLGNALFASGWYLVKTAWPAGLALPALAPPGGWPSWQVLAAAAVLAAGTGAAVRLARRRPHVTVGWLWYLGTLAPVSGIVQAGPQGMADRFTYVPAIGVAVIVGWEAAQALRPRGKYRALSGLLCLAAALALAAGTRLQLRHWRDSDALFARALAVDPTNFLAHNNWGLRRAGQQRWAEAAEHYRRSLSARPDFGLAHYNLGVALEQLGRPAEAAREFEAATLTLTAATEQALAHLRLTRLLHALGRDDEIVAHLEQAVALDPDSAAAAFDLGTTYLLGGRNEEAAGLLSGVVQRAPELADARVNLGYALLRLGRAAAALREFEAVVKLQPADAQVRYELGLALRRTGREQEALAAFREALRLQPGHQPATDALAAR